jgi:hypothetical protein
MARCGRCQCKGDDREERSRHTATICSYAWLSAVGGVSVARTSAALAAGHPIPKIINTFGPAYTYRQWLCRSDPPCSWLIQLVVSPASAASRLTWTSARYWLLMSTPKLVTTSNAGRDHVQCLYQKLILIDDPIRSIIVLEVTIEQKKPHHQHTGTM